VKQRPLYIVKEQEGFGSAVGMLPGNLNQ
jgi:hypothetical protein